MTQVFFQKKICFLCANCGGRMMTLAGLRNLCRDRDFANALWQAARYGETGTGPVCPSCQKLMRRVGKTLSGAAIELDICDGCQLIWFDPGELERIPLPEPEKKEELPEKVREVLALRQIELDESRLRNLPDGFDQDANAPDEVWKYLPALLGMPVELDAPGCNRKPVVTWIVAALCVAVYALTFKHLDQAADNWGFIPDQWTRHGGLTIITSMFLHGGIVHLLGNLYFLIVFGDNVEDELGRWKYLALIAASGVSALLLHALCDPRTGIPCVGASGFISGVIACYAFCFPRVRLSFMFCRNVIMAITVSRNWFAIPAWGAFAIWVVLQLTAAVLTSKATGGGVAFMAHLGGAIPGIIFAIYHRYRLKKSYQDWAAEQDGRQYGN
ncbi:MAG: rhomboid family intramembrane serine protease [Victivallaceae bacterium]